MVSSIFKNLMMKEARQITTGALTPNGAMTLALGVHFIQSSHNSLYTLSYSGSI